MNARLSIPRDQWRTHPNFKTQALLLGSHESFRRVSEDLIAHLRAGGELGPAAILYRRFTAAMRSHEGYEEHKLYPYLSRRWGASFAEAEAGHHALHALDRRVREAIDRARSEQQAQEPAEGERQALVQRLVEHDRVLREHLELEEDLVIPLLLQLSPAEFEIYYHSSIEELLERLPPVP